MDFTSKRTCTLEIPRFSKHIYFNLNTPSNLSQNIEVLKRLCKIVNV